VKPHQMIQQAADELRTWGAVALIGAGASLRMGLPLTKQLNMLLWHAVDADDALTGDLAVSFSVPPAPAKALIGDDPERIRVALEALSKSPVARRTYQRGFARLDAERGTQHSAAHEALAELVHRGHIHTVISLNWDTLLERAYHRRYGVSINANELVLHKPHGDAANPETDWILPHEKGFMPSSLVHQLNETAREHPRCLMIVGYSEQDEEVVATVVSPLSSRWRVIRIGPHVRGELSIALPADEALPELARAVNSDPEVPGWEYVTFENQHDLANAIAGYRLGPADVKVCPRFPEEATAYALLQSTKSVEIVGKSGCGKSITAYHVAYDMCCGGWEVLRLSRQGMPADDLVGAVSALPHKTLLIVDDAQTLDSQIPRRLFEMTSHRLAAMIVTTDERAIQAGGVRIAAGRAVATLAEEFYRRRGEVLTAARMFDDSIGEGYLDVAIEDRLKEAAKSDTPWQFNFVLRGGWRRARREIATLRDQERADLLLGAIAAGQLVSLDTDVSESWLQTVSSTLGFDHGRYTRCLDVLKRQRAIVGEEGYRCPHVQFAKNVLRVLFEHRNRNDWEQLFALLRNSVQLGTPALRGISWLLFDVWYADAFLVSDNCGKVIDECLWSSISKRCLAATTSEERRDAAFALSTLSRWRRTGLKDLTRHASTIGAWTNEADGESAYGIATLLNDTINESRDLLRAILAYSNPQSVAHALAKSEPSEGYAWGYLLTRLSFGTDEWRDRFRNVLDAPAIFAMVEHSGKSEIIDLSKLAEGLVNFDEDLALAVAKKAVPMVADALTANPIQAFRDSQDLRWSVLGYYPHFLRRRPPKSTQRRVARTLVKGVDPIPVARAISTSRRRDWEVFADMLFFVREVMLRHARKIAAAIEFDALDKATEGQWRDVPRELRLLIAALAFGPDQEPARSWISSHEEEFVSIDSLVAAVAPEAVATALRRGCRLKLGDNWRVVIAAIARLAKIDEKIAIGVLDDNCLAIAKTLSNLAAVFCEELPTFLSFVKDLAPETVQKILEAIDPALAEKEWAARLRGRAEERKAVAVLLDMINGEKGELTAVATRLRQRFPRASSHATKSQKSSFD